MTTFGYNPCTKESQLINVTDSRKSRSELHKDEVKRLKERSNGVCEKCDRSRASEKAHVERRWRSEGKPTVEDFIHLCINCHRWCDSCDDGRNWLIDFQTKLLLKEGA